jgi:pimeloyl-ACP methyl ester carboxylesterase
VSESVLRRVPLPCAALEVEVRGSGEPVLLIQTALVVDHLRPLANQPPLQAGYQIIHVHRRGYAGSSPIDGPGSVERDADDCRDLLAALEIERAHVVGVSFSAAVALQLAARAAASVHSLTLIEPPPVHVPSADEFIAANLELIEHYRNHGPAAALDQFFTITIGPDWREQLERLLPGALAQVERDTDTFFASDLPALLAWQFGAKDASQITQPVLYVGGTESGPWFAEVRELIREWLPQAEDAVVAGAGHSLAVTHSSEVAAAVGAFFSRHPVGA